MKPLNTQAFGLSLGAFGAISMLVMALLAKAGVYTEAWDIMMQFHIFASLSVGGIIGGMVEAGLWSYVSGIFISTIYNRLT